MTTDIDRRAQMKYAERVAREEGLAEGRAEGMEKGRAEGMEKGRAEGRAEGALDKAYETARNLKAENIPADVIAKCTGLTLEQVENL